MCPLYKKNDRTDISNYRPITCLNTDYKLFTKILAERFAEVITDQSIQVKQASSQEGVSPIKLNS